MSVHTRLLVILVVAAMLALAIAVASIANVDEPRPPAPPLTGASERDVQQGDAQQGVAHTLWIETSAAVPLAKTSRDDVAGSATSWVTGRIVDAGGRPVGNVRVAVSETNGAALDTTSDVLDGSFTALLSPLTAARNAHAPAFTVIAHRAHSAPAVVTAARTAHPGAIDLGDIVLPPGGAIRGVVLDESGVPNTTARVRLIAVGGPLRRLDPAFAEGLLSERGVDADGGFAYEQLPEGAYCIEATAPCRARCRSARIAVAPTRSIEVPPLVLHTGHTLHGLVCDDAHIAVPFADVDLVRADGDRRVMHTQSDAHGNFQFEHLGAGRHHLRVRCEQAQDWLVRDVLAEMGGALVVQLPATTVLRGTVSDDGGMPVPRFVVRVSAARADAHPQLALGTTMRQLAAQASARREQEREQFPFGAPSPRRANGRDGSFTVERLLPGSYTVEVEAPLHACQRARLSVPLHANGSAAAIAVELRLPPR